MEKNTEKQNVKRRSTFCRTVLHQPHESPQGRMCQLLCKVSIDTEWEQIGTKVSVNPAIWNPERGRADGRSENAVTVNRAIDDLTREITGHYDRIKNSLGGHHCGAGQKRGQGHRTETAHPAGTLQGA